MKPFLKSPVRETRTPGSVGVRAYQFGGLSTRRKAGDHFKRLPIADYSSILEGLPLVQPFVVLTSSIVNLISPNMG